MEYRQGKVMAYTCIEWVKPRRVQSLDLEFYHYGNSQVPSKPREFQPAYSYT